MEIKTDSKSLKKIGELVDTIIGDDEAAAKGTKAALRRMRVGLSELSKLCKEARKEILVKMSAK